VGVAKHYALTTKNMATEKKSSKSKKTTTVKKKIDFTTIYDKEKSYPINEAIEIVKKITNTKFDASVEVHYRLGINNKKN